MLQAADNDWNVAKPTSWSAHRLGSISTGTQALRDEGTEDNRSYEYLHKVWEHATSTLCRPKPAQRGPRAPCNCSSLLFAFAHTDRAQ